MYKHRELISDPVIRYKSVEALPGIGPVTARKLREAGFLTADQVLMKYLELKKNEKRFTSWLNIVSGASSHWSSVCFNGLNDWYNKWGQDVRMPMSKAIMNSDAQRQKPSSISNRMLLEQKILQFNFNSQDDKLMGLTNNYQAISLVDISKPLESRPSASTQRLNKSHVNIAKNSLNFLSNEQQSRHPHRKSVNFKEFVVMNAEMPKKTPLLHMSNRSISPILKSRSLTPDITKIVKKSQGSRVKTFEKPVSMNNLNLVSRTKNRDSNKAKSVENISGSNTFTRSKPKSSRKQQLIQNEELICTCEIGNPHIRSWNTLKTSNTPQKDEDLVCTCEIDNFHISSHNSANTQEPRASQNIEEYFVEKQYQNVVTSTPVKSIYPEFEENNLPMQPCHENELNSPHNTNEMHESLSDESSSTAIPNSDEESENELGLDCLVTNIKDFNNNKTLNSTTLDSRNLETIKLNNDVISTSILEIDEYNESVLETDDIETKNENLKKTKSPQLNFDYTNEDSGLDETSRNIILESQTSGDDLLNFENIESISPCDSERTFEVNDTTDTTESGFEFVSHFVDKSETIDEKDSEYISDTGDEELKRTNIRLFCDMLSSDLEQLPMEKFRKLKLKILQLVYSEIDKNGEVQ